MMFKIQFFLLIFVFSSLLKANESNSQFQISLKSYPLETSIENFDSPRIKKNMLPSLVSPLDCEMCDSSLTRKEKSNYSIPVEVTVSSVNTGLPNQRYLTIGFTLSLIEDIKRKS